MSNDAMKGIRAKLDRAKEHLKQLEAELALPYDPHDYGIVSWDDLQSREHVVSYRTPDNLAIRFGVLAGEVIGQVRSVLDHVVCDMVPTPTDPKRLRQIGFPVVWKQSDYKSQRKLKIEGINSAAATIIEGLQPFNNGGVIAPIWVLNELWNRDKHRVLNLVGIAANAYKRLYRFADGTSRAFIDDVPLVDFKSGAEIMRLKHPDFFNPPKVRMEAHVDICFKFWNAGPATNQPVLELLAGLLKFSDSTVEALIATK